jgi:hypothetical protein
MKAMPHLWYRRQLQLSYYVYSTGQWPIVCRDYLRKEHLQRAPLGVSAGLTRKYWTSPKRAGAKLSSLFGLFIRDKEKKFYNLESRH